MTEPLDELITRLHLLEQDHEPDGWPAVQMCDVTRLLAEVDRRVGIQTWLAEARLERDVALNLIAAKEAIINELRQQIAFQQALSCRKLNITDAELRLMAGEMSAQELRTVRAVLNGLKNKNDA